MQKPTRVSRSFPFSPSFNFLSFPSLPFVRFASRTHAPVFQSWAETADNSITEATLQLRQLVAQFCICPAPEAGHDICLSMYLKTSNGVPNRDTKVYAMICKRVNLKVELKNEKDVSTYVRAAQYSLKTAAHIRSCESSPESPSDSPGPRARTEFHRIDKRPCTETWQDLNSCSMLDFVGAK